MKKLFNQILASTMLLSLASTGFAVEVRGTVEGMEVSQETLSTKNYGSMTYQSVVASQYEDGSRFSEGLAAVKKDGKWGYIDENGGLVIDFIYDDAGNFSEGLALVGTREVREEPWGGVTIDSSLGMIDTSGRYTSLSGVITNGESRQETDNFISADMIFHNGFVAVNNMMGHYHGCALYNTQGIPVEFPLAEEGSYTRAVSPVNEGYVVGYDWTGKSLYEITPEGVCTEVYYLDGDLRDIVGMNQGYLLVRDGIEEEATGYFTEGYGFYDLSGQGWLIEPQYRWVAIWDIYGKNEAFGDLGLAMVQKEDQETWEYKMGAINKSGDVVIPFIYEGLMCDSYGMIPYQLDGKWGYLDSNANVAVAAQYDMVSFYGAHGLTVVLQDGVGRIIDTKGQVVSGSEIVEVSAYFGDGTVTMLEEMVIVRENGLVGYGKIDYLPHLPTAADMSDWAVSLVVESIEADLVPVSLQNLYEKNISRSDFAHLAVESLAVIMGTDVNSLVTARTGKGVLAHVSDYPFTDCSDASVVAANALGIVSGKGSGIFDPYAEITRQEAAIMLKNMVSVAGGDVSNAPSLAVADVSAIAEWAVEAVNFVSGASIMGTMGDNQFSPNTGYTREQSFITVLNVLKNLK